MENEMAFSKGTLPRLELCTDKIKGVSRYDL